MARWEPLEAGDLARLDAIQHVVHADLPERLEFLAEKLRLFPDGCRKLVREGEMLGYGLAHPWRLGDVPVLNAPLDALPAAPDCLHMHDVAILPEGRGAGAAGAFVVHLREVARRLGIDHVTCVSVYGTAPFWGRYGFAEAKAKPALSSYGEGAIYMTARVEGAVWLIRSARPDDAEAACAAIVRSISELCGPDHGGNQDILTRWLANKTPDVVRGWIRANSSGFHVAERKDGLILAVGSLQPSGEIGLNYVAPEGRFQGISKAMMRALEARASAHGLEACTLTSTATAHRFYRALGYVDSASPRTLFGMTGYPMRRDLTG